MQDIQEMESNSILHGEIGSNAHQKILASICPSEIANWDFDGSSDQSVVHSYIRYLISALH